MGKNQAYKAIQRARLGSGSGGPDEVDDGMTDGSFHSPEWHAARLASLNTSHTVTWEEYKRRQKEEAAKKGELEADKDRMMREYRAQLDAERAAKLAKGSNHSRERSHHKKEKKDKDRKKKDKDYKKNASKKRKHSRRHSDSSSSDTSSESSSSDDEERASKRSKLRSKRRKERKHKSKSKSRHSGSDSEDNNGPVPLSRFFGTVKT